MPRFIYLNRFDGKPMLLNTDAVKYIAPNPEEQALTEIYFSDSFSVTVDLHFTDVRLLLTKET